MLQVAGARLEAPEGTVAKAADPHLPGGDGDAREMSGNRVARSDRVGGRVDANERADRRCGRRRVATGQEHTDRCGDAATISAAATATAMTTRRLARGACVEPERAARLVDQLPTTRVALGGILGHRAREHGIDLGRQARDSAAGDRHRILEVRVQSGDVRGAVERQGSRQRLEEQAAERVLVGPAVEHVAADLLGRDVVDGAQPLPVGGAALGGPLGQAEVGEVAVLATVLLVDEDVRRLDVAMDEAAAVGGVERIGDLRCDRDRTSRIQRAFATEQCLQVRPDDEAHRDEQAPVCLTRLVDRNHVGVVEPCREPGLAKQPLAKAVVVGE